jgi:hypothetical protein
MRIIPNFSLDTFPFVLIMDAKGLTFVDLKNAQAYKMIESETELNPMP